MVETGSTLWFVLTGLAFVGSVLWLGLAVYLDSYQLAAERPPAKP